MKKSHYAVLMGSVYVLAGTYHFINPSFYLQIMPKYLPNHLELVYLSGLAEIIAGGLLIPKKTRKLGAWGIIVLLIAVFPANIQMAINEYAEGGFMFYISLIRLPFQFLLMYWAYILQD
ncbi:MauE/DoxX family redox-associated membrane protein [Pedobacter alpinus]|uniref:MauE/DoxX family redox-associated membrane protein n=1 Tax=Pedobacter alpinus TaxID=1590643 RepID=A0ABW5TRC2_9SPHI